MKPRLFHALFCAALVLALGLDAAAKPRPKPKPQPKPKPRVQAPLGPQFEDRGLADWRRQPFSDHASHGVLLRQPQGLLGWRLRSAAAFGSLAAQPHPAKDLLDLRLEFLVEGELQPRFAGGVTLTSYPRWAEEAAEDGPLVADAAAFFVDTDVVVAAATVRNRGDQPLRLRPRLRLRRDGQGLSAALRQPSAEPELFVSLDRGAAVGRRLVEHVAVRLGGQSARVDRLAPGGPQPLLPGAAQALPAGQALDLELTWPAPQLLAPGQSLRVPLLLAWGGDEAALQQQARLHWRDNALPVGKAWREVKVRWDATKRRLPEAEPARQRLLARAGLDLLMAQYAPRLNLGGEQFSAQKGVRDAFYSVDSPLAALGWAELDMGRAQASLLELAGFSAAAPRPLPPYTGDEKLDWEAAGLPLHGFAAWELYHRDPQAPRAGDFLARFGERLRNECAWWPGARDGDGNGLYAFARDEEMPPYLRRSILKNPLPVDLLGLTGTAVPSLQTWSLALSSLVAWQMQAAAALAAAKGAQAEADPWMEQSLKIRQALRAEAWNPQTQAYHQGLDATWLLLLGLEDDFSRAQTWLEKTLIPALEAGEKPWVEHGVETPWRFYILVRTLAAYGYLDLARELSNRFLDAMEQRDVLDYEYGSDPSQWVGGSVATATVVSQLILQRQEQEVFLTENTGEFSASMTQFRTLDGNFYMKRYRLPEKKSKYADIHIETPNKGKILAEKTFILSSDEPLAIQIQSEWPLDITDLQRKAPIFKQSRRVELLVRPKARIQVRFFQPTEAK